MAPKSRVDAREYHKKTGIAEFNCVTCSEVWDEGIRDFYNRWEEDMVALVQSGEWSQKEAQRAKKKNHPKRLEEIFHRKGRINVKMCHKCRKKYLAKVDLQRSLGTDGRMYGEGRA